MEIAEMKEDELKERIAAGLRTVSSKKPIGLLLANGFFTDEKEMFGLPIFVMGSFRHTPYSDFDCPVFPLFENNYADYLEKEKMYDDYNFARAFLEYGYKGSAKC